MNCILTEHLTFLIYGMCIMFYSMMIWFFWRKGSDRLSRLIALLMAVLDMECMKDLALYPAYFGSYEMLWHVSNSIDMLVIPIYIFVLMELVKPGWLSWKKAVLHEATFVLPLALYSVTGNSFGLMPWQCGASYMARLRMFSCSSSSVNTTGS